MRQETPEFLYDLDLALNKIDFYRLFKAICVEFNLELLILCDLNHWPDEPEVHQILSILNCDGLQNLALDSISVGRDVEIFDALRNSILVKQWDLKQHKDQIEFCGNPDGRLAITIPIHTATGRHCGFFITLKVQDFAKLQIDSMRNSLDQVFEKFDNLIISPQQMPVISPRELEVIKWSAEGKTSIETAVILGLSEHTINSYTTKILQKLQVVNRAQMVAKAIRMGLIQ